MIKLLDILKEIKINHPFSKNWRIQAEKLVKDIGLNNIDINTTYEYKVDNDNGPFIKYLYEYLIDNNHDCEKPLRLEIEGHSVAFYQHNGRIVWEFM